MSEGIVPTELFTACPTWARRVDANRRDDWAPKTGPVVRDVTHMSRSSSIVGGNRL